MLLAMAARRIRKDWQECYHYAPVLIETFVEAERVHRHLLQGGQLDLGRAESGRGKKDIRREFPIPIKDIWLYPLVDDFRKTLTQ